MSDELNALEAKNADARRLARLASTAVQVEPELLRRLRLRLLPTADASAEADLWFSEAVDSKSPNAMVLRADLRAQLQQELSAADRDDAAAIIAEMHAGISEVVRIHEQVDALSLRGDLADAEKVLQPIVRTLYDTDHAGLARWAARAFAQFQPSAQTTQTAWTMMRAAAVRLRGDTPASGWQSVESAIRNLRRTGVYLALYRNSLVIGSPAIEHAMRIEIPVTEPLMLEVTSSLGSSRVAFGFGQLTEVPADPHDVSVTTVTGERYAIKTAVKLDDWAVVAGDDTRAFQAWLQDPAGGAVPREQVLAYEGDVDSVFYALVTGRAPVVRTGGNLYVYLAKPEVDPALATALLLSATRFQFLFVFVNAPDWPREQNSQQVFAFVFDRPDFATKLIDGLSGNAATDGRVTTRSLSTFFEMARKDLYVEAGIVESNEFAVFVTFRPNERTPLVRLLDPQLLEIARYEPKDRYCRRLLRGDRYFLDAPQAFLLQPFEVSENDREPVVYMSRPQHDHWIIVAGTASVELPADVRLAATALAQRLAGSGYRLIVGDWNGTDTVCLEACLATLALLDLYPREQLRCYTTLKRDTTPFNTIQVQSEDEEFDVPLRQASALIVIGGRGGTLEYARRAKAAGVPVIPVGSTGGDAAKLYSDFPDKISELDTPILNAEHADAMAIRIVAWLLDHLRPVPDGRYVGGL